MSAPNEVFLSHSSEDRGEAVRLVEELTRHGVPVWYSEQQIQGAAQWLDEIGRALARCDWFLLLLSPQAVASRWVKRELVYALTNERYDERITPLVLEDCEAEQLSWILPSLQTIDLQPDFADACRAVLRPWGIGYRAR